MVKLSRTTRKIFCDRKMFINGDYQEKGTRRIPVINPATEEQINTVPDACLEDVNSAVECAYEAFCNKIWRSYTPTKREECILQLATLMEENKEELAMLIVCENGKLVKDALREVANSIRFTRYMAGWATKVYGDTLDVSLTAPQQEFFAYTKREPVGVVAAIIPWNMPLAMAIWKIVPALVCGCTVVVKPSEETPLSALRLAELIVEAGIPGGVVNVVTGYGDTCGKFLVEHSLINKIAFTGSTTTGKIIGQRAMENMTRVSLELGGKSPVIILDDADLSMVDAFIAKGIFYNQGQICAAGSRLYVARSIFEETVQRVVKIAEKMKLGSGLEQNVDLGPLVSKKQQQKVFQYIEEAIACGATVLSGGKIPQGKGFFVEPTILTNVNHGMSVVQEEVFGPVLVAMPFDDIEEVIAKANDSTYGLSASIYSQNISTIHRMIPQIKAGTIFVNSPVRTDPNLPFGGFKQSGLGREHGSSMFDLYTELKSVVITY
ncbi:aldehyde dehydrogenase family protein [Candidatus Uabimicrobium amorphum]|uniref:Aldehyde dehydrogenase n=1 Tax=Uabimicrobium amorphum TaxID=2596890 RepID=A0A5S9IVZ4_UABAM|nr:aldehyde dehydrogenase family protein [Candidatus Uabimicrobium amorphum]BBM87565.1 aldehyde dehydrogenase [Candidatus Uabimicrobium amorphum]